MRVNMSRIILGRLAGLIAIPVLAVVADETVKISYHGAGWVQGGRIQQSTDTISDGVGQNFNDNWTQNSGGQITAVAKLEGGWEGGLGLGAIQSPDHFRGPLVTDKETNFSWSPYVTEARLTYTVGDVERPTFQVTAGSFHFNYNSDVKNLGLYLLRGLVYPNIILSGFESKDMLPIANVFGLNVRHETGGFRGDFILNSETDIKPYFDLSLAYLARYHFNGFEIGAGINWYRGIPNRSKLTSPGKDCSSPMSKLGVSPGDGEVCYILDTVSVDSAAGTAKVDTITGSLSGIKLMGRFSVDPKALLGLSGSFGPNDLIFYSEAAVLGVKNYPKYYNDILRRIPVMFGFNIPTFGWLDYLSVEAEYFANRNMSDYQKELVDLSWVPRPRQQNEVKDAGGNVTGTRPTDTRADNWKWSLYASKVIAEHLKLSAQMANDHLRTGGWYLVQTQSETLNDTFDWYWMFKVAYYF
jgi:hypothetical protein